jgi:polysaccharide export outer membrane protein
VQGAVTRAGVLPIESATLRLSGMLAQAGGTIADPAEVRVDVTRGGRNYSVGLGELYSDPKLDIALRPGDRIVVRPIEDRYIVLGASGGQAELAFRGSSFTLMQALARAGGLRDTEASPDGIYLFRYETAATASALLGPEPLPDFPVVNGMRPIVYRLDMTDPAALFAARRFRMRNGDTIVVTNAPLTELRKIASIFSSVTAPAQQVAYIQNQ